jgi:large subunit ribosomal protein L30e
MNGSFKVEDGSLADLSNDVRLAVDTGKVSLGYREVMKSVSTNTAKVVVVAEKGKKSIVDDINHACKIAGIKLLSFKGGSLELGTVCGKPYSVNSLAVIEAGNSSIINEQY